MEMESLCRCNDGLQIYDTACTDFHIGKCTQNRKSSTFDTWFFSFMCI